mgnify:CR=1 FL=1|jgi:uncharacterized LabA/DUF88 family protein
MNSQPGSTGVYVDGYNLYYGRLRGTIHKWLDLVTLCDNLLVQRAQSERLVKLTLFTAPALARFATHSGASVNAQAAYHRALAARHPDRFGIVYGSHTFDKNGTLLPTFVEGAAYDRTVRSSVWKLEEKKTDVNLAMAMYRDAVRHKYERVILFSNDSDAEPVLEAIRQDFPKIMVGLVLPIHPPKNKEGITRRVSGSLVKQAHWVTSALSDEQLEAAHLPLRVPTNKKPILKPVHW